MINGIKIFEKIILVTVLIATVVAIGNEFMFMYSSQEWRRIITEILF